MHHVKTYCKESSIHGIPQLVDDERHLTEKIFWLILVIISFVCCGILIYEIGEKLSEGSLITYISETAINCEDIEFPAVTFCPEVSHFDENYDLNKIKYSLQNGSMMYENFTEDFLKTLQAVSLIVGDDFLNEYNADIDTEDVMEYLKKVNWKWTKDYGHQPLITFDFIMGIKYSEIITSKGFCYSFNLVNSSELFRNETISKTFNHSSSAKTLDFIENSNFRSKDPDRFNFSTPYKAHYPFSGLTFLLGYRSVDAFHFAQINYKKNSNEIRQGMFFYIHSPFDYVNKMTNNLRTLLGKTLFILLTPKMTLIDIALHNYEPSRRGCFLPHERPLKFFTNYTKSNCQSECGANETLSHCGCVQFFMVRENSTRVCGVKDMKCYKDVELKLQENDTCKCLLRCEEIQFDIEMKENESVGKRQRFVQTDVHELASRIRAFYSSPSFFPDIFQRQFSVVEFFAYAGGALGLFLGFSAISAFEFFYYFSIRVLASKLRVNKVHSTNCERKKTNEIFRYLIEFSENSSIHGMPNILYHQRKIIEKLIWIAVVLISMTFCTFEVKKIYQTYAKSPIVLTYDEDLDLLKKIEFPAITFNSGVNMDLFYRSNIQGSNMFIYYMGPKRARDSLIRDARKHNFFDRIFTKSLLCRDTKFFTLFEFNHANSPPVENLMLHIRNESEIEWFKNSSVRFNSRFSPEIFEILGTQGYGFVFNMAPPERLFQDSVQDYFMSLRKFKTSSNGIFINSSNYPLQTSAKDTDGLQVTLERSLLKKDVELCNSANFIVHSPYELSSAYYENEVYGFFDGFDFLVLVQPKVIKTDENLKIIEPETRECYFAGEKVLDFFKIYTPRNCELECLSKFYSTAYKVECVPFYLLKNNQSIPMCDYRHEEYRLLQEKYFKIEKTKESCGCLPLCNSVDYKVEVLPLRRNDFNYSAAWLGGYEYSQEFLFKYKDEEIHFMRRRLAMTFNDFLAQAGGMMGLFAGISMLSLIEVGYYFTIRLITNAYRIIRTTTRYGNKCMTERLK